MCRWGSLTLFQFSAALRLHPLIHQSDQYSPISASAPTLTSAPEAKDKFYDDLSYIISEVRDQDPPFILGDLNARVGADHKSWTSCVWDSLASEI